jgi:hypothetical protein
VFRAEDAADAGFLRSRKVLQEEPRRHDNKDIRRAKALQFPNEFGHEGHVAAGPDRDS